MPSDRTPTFQRRRPLALASLAVLGAAFTLVQSGCHTYGSVPAPRPTSADAPKTQEIIHDDWAKVGYRLDWIGYPFAGIARPNPVELVAFDDLVVAQDQSSTITVLEASNGHRRWSTDLTGPNTRWLGVARQTGVQAPFIVSSDTEAFTLASGTGNLLSRDRYEQVISTPTLLVDDLLIAGTPTGRVQAHLLGKGLSAWGFISNGAFATSPVMMGDSVAIVSQGGDVLFFARNGSLLGRGRVFGGLDADPASDGLHLALASRDQSLWLLAIDGSQLWRHRTVNALTHSPVFFGGSVVCDLGAEGLSALDVGTGGVTWHNAEVHGDVIGVRGGNLVVWDKASLFSIDPKTGDVLSKIAAPGFVKFSTTKFEDGDLYAASADGSLAKFIPR